MNRKLAVAAGAVAATVIVAAVFGLMGAFPQAGPVEPASGIVVSAELIESPVIPQAIADSNNGFAIDFYRQILDGEEGKNIFFSPASIYVAFSVLYEGAMENTASQMQDVFGFEPDAATRHNATAHMMSSINRDDPHATLSMANALWILELLPYASYVNTAQNTYLADVEEVTPEDGAKRINDWAANKTNDKITEVIQPGDLAADPGMVITNAIYFKGTWVTEFPKEDTRMSSFWINSDSSKETDFMNVNDMFNYTKSDGAQVLRMPYKGDRLAMLVILPTERHGLASLEESVSAQQIDTWIENLGEQKVIVSVPKFEMRTNYDLIKPLRSMGVTDLFDAPDLGGMSLVPMSITKAVQDAYVKVNEEGTEAAAVTTIVVAIDEALPLPPRFVADHPFLFAIYDEESGMILFMGRISDPTA